MFDVRPGLAVNGTFTPQTKTFPSQPSSSPSPAVSFISALKNNLSLEKLKEFRQQKLANIRPWFSEFFGKSYFGSPSGIGMAQNRLFHNLSYFQANYIIIVAVLTIHSLFQHLFCAALMAAIVLGFIVCRGLPEDYVLKLRTISLSKRQLMVGLILCGVIMFLFSGIGSAFFWLLGLSAIVVGCHAIFHDIIVESDFNSGV